MPHGYLSDEEGGEKTQMEFLAAQSEQVDVKRGPKNPDIRGPFLAKHKRDAQFGRMDFSCVLYADPMLLNFPFDAKVVRVSS